MEGAESPLMMAPEPSRPSRSTFPGNYHLGSSLKEIGLHYYQFNIADYRKDTTHLTPVEHYIYRWLIDEYHLSEQPVKNDVIKLLRRLGLDISHRESLEIVLDEFFDHASDEDYKPVDLDCHPEYAQCGQYPELCQYWVHKRIDQDIETYRNLTAKKSAAGKASAIAKQERKEHKTNTCSTPVQQSVKGVQQTNNQEPVTSNHKPITKDQKTRPRFTPPTVEEVRQYCLTRNNAIDPEAFVAHYETNGWVQGKGKPIKNWKMAVITWEKSRNEKSNGNTGQSGNTRRLSPHERVRAKTEQRNRGVSEQVGTAMGGNGGMLE